ncbi:sigma-70 family RNA polymerase sigma factor, partial [Bacteroidales bacterium OttesenSCG-928-C03]|nr:sigma-70 family RNA polymerase sigma factor [Bacteroidales bacterium OttesenSCG-928-C03]
YRKSFARPKIIDSYDGSDSFLQIKSENETTDVAFIKKENAEILKEKLSKLDDKYRVPLILFYFKELSYNDISEIMKLPLSTVKFRLNQAKNILRKEMEVYFE